MNCPKCGQPWKIVAKEDDELYTGFWHGKYVCKPCGIYVDAIGPDFDTLIDRLDEASKGTWKKRK